MSARASWPATATSSGYSEQYANNVPFESSIWDVKAIFGTLGQAQPPGKIRMHNGMYLPWVQAELALYYLFLHVQFHEAQHGRIAVPQGVQPDRPSDALAHLADFPQGKTLIENASAAWSVLFGTSDERT